MDLNSVNFWIFAVSCNITATVFCFETSALLFIFTLKALCREELNKKITVEMSTHLSCPVQHYTHKDIMDMALFKPVSTREVQSIQTTPDPNLNFSDARVVSLLSPRSAFITSTSFSGFFYFLFIYVFI